MVNVTVVIHRVEMKNVPAQRLWWMVSWACGTAYTVSRIWEILCNLAPRGVDGKPETPRGYLNTMPHNTFHR